MNHQRLIRPLRQHGMTLVELLVILGLIGVLANFVVPNFVSGIVKARANEIMGEYSQVQLAANTFWADTGAPPRYWTSKEQHPDLATYLAGFYPHPEGLGLEKHFVRYEEVEESWGFRSGYLVRSTGGDSPTIRSIERQFDGPMAVLRPGREVLLIIEALAGADGGGGGGGGGDDGGGGDGGGGGRQR